MLSQKAKYALQALAYLAKYHNQGPVLIGTIAEQKKIPLKFLENILLELKNGGVLESFRGRTGGYALNQPPENIKLTQVIRLINGPIAMLSCVSLNFYEACENCTQIVCGINPVMAEARDAVLKVLEQRTVADIMDK